MSPRVIVLLVLGALMLGVGAYVVGRLFATGAPLTGNRWLDLLFAVFFVLRGAMNLTAARRLSRGTRA